MVGMCRSGEEMVGYCVGVGGGDGGLCRSRGRRWWAPCVGVGGGDGGHVLGVGGGDGGHV